MAEAGPARWRLLAANPTVRLCVLAAALLGCAIAIAFILGERVGGDGLIVGALLALLPVPFVVGAFVWLGRARPLPWQSLLFAFGWGSCAGALVALVANTWSVERLIDLKGEEDAELLGLTLVAPVVEELVKGLAVLLLFVTVRRRFQGLLDGLIPACVSATGFAFTENVLYFGRAFADSRHDEDGVATTLATFLVRAIMSPFAHPLFTSMIGLGFGIAVLARNRYVAVLAPIGGYVLAAGLHAAWNGSAVGGVAFLGVYFLVMLPILGGIVTFAVILRRDQLRAVEEHLPRYAAAGWFRPFEALVLSSMADRTRATRYAKAVLGPDAAPRMRAYQSDVTLLAELRRRVVRKGPGAVPDFARREQELLGRLWTARAPLARVLDATPPSPRWPYLRPAWPGTPPWGPVPTGMFPAGPVPGVHPGPRPPYGHGPVPWGSAGRPVAAAPPVAGPGMPPGPAGGPPWGHGAPGPAPWGPPAAPWGLSSPPAPMGGPVPPAGATAAWAWGAPWRAPWGAPVVPPGAGVGGSLFPVPAAWPQTPPRTPPQTPPPAQAAHVPARPHPVPATPPVPAAPPVPAGPAGPAGPADPAVPPVSTDASASGDRGPTGSSTPRPPMAPVAAPPPAAPAPPAAG